MQYACAVLPASLSHPSARLRCIFMPGPLPFYHALLLILHLRFEHCGAHSTANAHSLAKRCKVDRPPSKAGKEVLPRLSRRLPPKSGGKFPQA